MTMIMLTKPAEAAKDLRIPTRNRKYESALCACVGVSLKRDLPAEQVLPSAASVDCAYARSCRPGL